MNSFKIGKILIPIDFSETSLLAIEQAAYVARSFQAELVLLHVVEKHWEKFSIVVPEMRINAPEGIINAIEKRLEEIAKSIFLSYGVKSNCITANGTIFSEIISVSREQNIDLIVMGTHGTSGVVEFFIGSNAYKVVTSSECPVLTVQTHIKKVGFKNILLPIDNSTHSRQKVNHAIIMARHFSSQLYVVGLADFNDEKELGKFEIKIEQIEDYIHRCDLSCTTRIVKGTNQAIMTAEQAEALGADLIIIMTDQEENISGRLLGTYAQQIVNHSKIPVMSIQPVFGNVPSWTDNG